MLKDAKYLNKNERDALEEIKRRVSALLDVKQYILFGSKARGDSLPDSDIDLLIVTGNKLSFDESNKIVHEVFKVNLDYGTNYSFIDVDYDTWENGLISVMPFHDNVDKEGIVV